MEIERPRTEHLMQLWCIWQEAFGDTEESVEAFRKTAFSPDRARVALENGVPVAALYWFDCSCYGRKIAYLYAIATDPAYRGRGICHRLMEKTHRDLQAQGYVGALLVPAEEHLFGFYRRMGYETCSAVCELTCEGVAGEITLTQIEKTEYASLRRQYLPSGGVIQEGVTLDFLETWEHFWKGEDFLLAGHCNGDRFLGAELLGNASLAPQITHTMGCRSGSFRTPGEGRPFAMYLPLADATAPSYFGLALD